MSSNTHSPCAGCKHLRGNARRNAFLRCTSRRTQPQKFANIHRRYSASNVTKILNELNPAHRKDAVTSLAYEAEARVKDPMYGCVGLISILQSRLKQVQPDLYNAKKELSTYIGPQAAMVQEFHPSQQLMFEAQQQELVRFNVNGMDSGNWFNQMDEGRGGGGGGCNGVVSAGLLCLGGSMRSITLCFDHSSNRSRNRRICSARKKYELLELA